MKAYAGLVMLFRFFVELMLLLGADRLYRQDALWWRVLLGAALGGLHGGLCLLPGFAFLNGTVWQFSVFCGMALTAYGLRIQTVAVFVLLNLALDGLGSGMGKESLWYLAAGAPIVAFLCMTGLGDKAGALYVPVELSYGGKSVQLTALRDTGNTLRDPVTGKSVLIIGAEAACQLTGLSRQQLRTPLEAIVTAQLPGLRLIPYHTVGQSTGFLLALQMPETRIGRKTGSCLVAFAPEGLSAQGTYQALTGGVV